MSENIDEFYEFSAISQYHIEGLISREEIFVDWIVKTFHRYIFKGKYHFTR